MIGVTVVVSDAGDSLSVSIDGASDLAYGPRSKMGKFVGASCSRITCAPACRAGLAVVGCTDRGEVVGASTEAVVPSVVIVVIGVVVVTCCVSPSFGDDTPRNSLRSELSFASSLSKCGVCSASIKVDSIDMGELSVVVIDGCAVDELGGSAVVAVAVFVVTGADCVLAPVSGWSLTVLAIYYM